jgi:hypothetical protein
LPYTIPEYIEIKATDGSTVAFLSPESDGLKECWVDDEQNGACTLEFELPLACEKWQYLTDKYRIYAGDKEFVILNPDAVDKQRDGKKLTGKIKAHESWVLLGKKYQTISNDPQNPSPPWGAVIIVSGGAAHGGFDPGSAGSALSYLLQGTGWTVGTVDVTGTYDLETEKESVLYNINQVQEKWGGILIWDSINKTVSLRDEATYKPYTGYQIRYAKNLKGITRTDDYDIVTRLYPFGENDLNIANVNGGLLYLDNHSYSDDILEGVWYNQDLADQTQLKLQGERQLAVMCKPRHNYKTEVLDLRSLPGHGHETFKRSDMVDLFDEDFGANARVRIIRYRYNVFQPWLCDMELGDPLEKIAASVAQTVLMAKFYKNVVAPNTSFQNLLKAIINTAATEINGASGDYTLVDGVSTWFDRDSETGELTGKLLRITPQGLIISYDGGQTWKLAISGEGFHADAGWVGKLNAGLITVGPETTFAPGYDPTLIDPSASATMGVDADCVGLWHFDGSLNSHKGVAAIGDANFDTGCFGQAVKVTTPISGDISTGKESGMSASSMYSSAYSPDNLVDGSIVFGTGTAFASASGAAFPQWHQIDLGDVFNIDKVRWINNRRSNSLPKDYTIAISETGAFAGEQTVVATVTGNTTYSTWVEHTFNPTKGRYVRMTVSAVVSGTYYELAEWQIHATRLGILKAPTTGLSASQGTINFRAKNLAESDNGSVLVDLPKSDNTQGIKAGIADDGKIFLSDSDKVSKSYTETSQADFNSGTLTDVVATSAGDLELTGTQYINLFGTAGKGDTLTGWSNDGTLSTNGEWIYNNANSTGGGYLTKAIAGSKYYFLAITAKTSATIAACRLNISQYDNSNNLLNNNTTTFNYTNMSSTAKRLGSKFQSEATAAKLQAVYIVNNSQVLYTKEYALIEITADEYNNLTVDELLAKYPYTTGTATTYKSSGTREKIVDLSGANPAGGTKIEWSKTTPTNTTVKVETALSIDGGSTYGAFTEVTSGQAIPGITSDTDLSNARLKIKETLSTTDTTKTPQLHSLSFTITESAGATVYGPNKSTLTGWDSISLAWKPDRLSLVVNDEEACYIENPGLPAAFGSYAYIGTDRNGANVINTLVDELRIDKVYRDVNIRTGWHKTGVPFYTSEDMKQWPGYVKVETDGLKVYDSSDDLRVLVGSWVEDAIRKYGIKIIDGEIYGSYIKTGLPEETDSFVELLNEWPIGGVMRAWGINGEKALEAGARNGVGTIEFFNGGISQGAIRVEPSPTHEIGLSSWGNNNGIKLNCYGTGEKLTLGPTGGDTSARGVKIQGNLNVNGSMSCTGSKPAQQVTENYGLRYLYATEAPEIIYYDRGVINLTDGEATVYLDPIYLECIEPDTELTPWQIWVQCYGENDVYVSEIGTDYFKVKERNDGKSNNRVVWKHEAIRNGYAGIRLMEVTI